MCVQLVVVFGILGQFVEKLEALFDDILSDDLQDLALLEHLTGDVEWEVLRIDHALHEVEVLWNDLFAILHDEHPSHVQLDVVLLLAILKEVKGRSSRDEE